MTHPRETAQAIPGIVVAGKIIRKDTPVYPEIAKQEHMGGTVILSAIISKEGTISSLDVIASPDRALSDSAVEAVKHWTYHPYLLNGQPTEVDTTITVNYNLNGR
jgi:protein TonB